MHQISFIFGTSPPRVATRLVGSLLKTSVGCIIFGRPIGALEPENYSIVSEEQPSFGHNLQSWTDVWDEVGAELDLKFEISATLSEIEEKMRFGLMKNKSLGSFVWTITECKGTR